MHCSEGTAQFGGRLSRVSHHEFTTNKRRCHTNICAFIDGLFQTMPSCSSPSRACDAAAWAPTPRTPIISSLCSHALALRRHGSRLCCY